MLFREEREERETPLRESWKEIQQRAQKEERWVKKALERANKECSKLFEPEPPPFKFLKLREPAEWQLFYTSLLERLVKTDTELKSKKEWDYVAAVIDPVRNDIIKRLTVPVTKANDWIKTVNEAAQWTVIEWRKDQSPADKYYRISRLSSKYGDKLEQIRESLN